VTEELLNQGLTVKEWLSRIEAKVDKIDAKLDGKADMSAVTALELRLGSRVEELQAEVQRLKIRIATASGGLALLVFVVQVGLQKGWL